MLPDLLGNSVIVAMDIAMSIAFLPSANADEIVLMALSCHRFGLVQQLGQTLNPPGPNSLPQIVRSSAPCPSWAARDHPARHVGKRWTNICRILPPAQNADRRLAKAASRSHAAVVRPAPPAASHEPAQCGALVSVEESP